MSRQLHEAILRAIHDSRAYEARGILVSPVLLATNDLKSPPGVLHSAIYTLFCAMAWRLARDTTFFISTVDVPGGVELTWEAREEVPLSISGDLRDTLREGPHGDLVDIAMGALERFCEARAGRIQTHRAPVPASPRFPRGEVVHRRAVVFLPSSREEGLARTQPNPAFS